jgi:hypothetical protein
MSREEQDYSEKRNFIRMFIEAPIQYCAKNSNDWKEGIGKDLSASGMAFSVGEAFKEGDLIEIKLKPATEVTPPLEATVKVIRATANEAGGYDLSTIIEEIHR